MTATELRISNNLLTKVKVGFKTLSFMVHIFHGQIPTAEGAVCIHGNLSTVTVSEKFVTN